MTKNRAARVWLPLVTATLAAVFLLAACGGSNDNGNGGSYGGGYGGGSTKTTPPTTTDGGTAVSIADMAFSPATLTVKAGTTVTWTNQDGVGHTVTSTDGPDTDAAATSLFDSGTLTQGDTFSYTFDEPGTYYYVCTIHATMASMHAEVIVE
jgi:plastocyanin